MHDAFAACAFNPGLASKLAQKLAAVWAARITKHLCLPQKRKIPRHGRGIFDNN